MRSSRRGTPAIAAAGGGADEAEKTDVEDSLAAGVTGQQLREEEEQDEEDYKAEAVTKVCVCARACLVFVHPTATNDVH